MADCTVVSSDYDVHDDVILQFEMEQLKQQPAENSFQQQFFRQTLLKHLSSIELSSTLEPWFQNLIKRIIFSFETLISTIHKPEFDFKTPHP